MTIDPSTDPERIATGLLLDAGRVLLGRRTTGRPYPGMWALPGGHVEPGESSRQAVVRELEEELGIRATLEHDTPEARSMLGGLERSVWLVRSWQGLLRNAAPEEHSELRWFAGPELARTALAPVQDVPVIMRALGC